MYETNGQFLAAFLRDEHLGEFPARWTQLADALVSTGRADEWVEAVREMCALHLTRRLVIAGVQIVGQSGEFDSLAERAVKQMVLDTMVVDYFLIPDIVARLEPAIRSARRNVADGTRRAVESLARREVPFCYLCGANLVFGEDAPTAFTIDHVWPRAYGGDSDIDNLLPACKSCNERKGHTAAWSMYPVQSLVVGYLMDDADLQDMPKEIKFAVQARAAAVHTLSSGLSLRDSYLALGRPGIPAVQDLSQAVDVFNLAFQVR